MATVIEVKNLTHRYNEGLPHCNTAVDNVSFQIQKGELAVLIGPSGCGKTTTLQLINRFGQKHTRSAP